VSTAGASTGDRHETRIVADPALPTILITREFDASPERVFSANSRTATGGVLVSRAVARPKTSGVREE
jgi:hypothetical protein